jgi:RNA polymerase sigma factor (sigma-70 family)
MTSTLAVTRVPRTLGGVGIEGGTREREMEAQVKEFELRELWRRYKEGEDAARERLVVAYSPLLQIANASILAHGGAVDGPRRLRRSRLAARHPPRRDRSDPQAAVDTSDLKDRLTDAIQVLPERERLVIALYYFENLTLREIGDVLGVTESRVSQLHSKSVLRLRSRLSPA